MYGSAATPHTYLPVKLEQSLRLFVLVLVAVLPLSHLAAQTGSTGIDADSATTRDLNVIYAQ